MPSRQPIVITSDSRHRQFATSAVAVQAIIINQDEQVLLLKGSSPKQGWQVVSGALEASETLLDGTLREDYEELGEDIQVHPLGTVHAGTFHYDESMKYMLAIYYLFSYQGGSILPGSDMIGSEYRWWTLDELKECESNFHHSSPTWILTRAIGLYRMWVNEPELALQPRLF
ncbi:NUDIX hydrolase [Thermodesulfobacteriota bacterium]